MRSRALMKMLKPCATLRYKCVEGDCRTFLIVWGQPNSGAFMMMIAFVTMKSSLVPLIEVLCAQI